MRVEIVEKMKTFGKKAAIHASLARRITSMTEHIAQHLRRVIVSQVSESPRLTICHLLNLYANAAARNREDSLMSVELAPKSCQLKLESPIAIGRSACWSPRILGQHAQAGVLTSRHCPRSIHQYAG